ncbi:MAG: hypothetical protein KAT34_14025 [Candidatus Aminicenantes bacterium]|nr:hypothetical protein [Candidatus Aminicenantes bacterium]
MTKKIAALCALFFLLTPGIFAYIDPGTGSYLVQILIAALVSVSLGVKIFWKNIKFFFKKVFSKDKPDSQ